MSARTARGRRTAGGRPGSRWFAAGYAGAAVLVGMELLLRKPGAASSLRAGSDDRGTTRLVAAAWGLAVEVPLLTRRTRLPALPAGAAPWGLGLQAAGIAVRAWSMRSLGTSYSRTLRTGASQPVVDTGPYRIVRHPGYLGSLLAWTGFTLTTRSAAALALVPGLLAGAYLRRIAAEESLLARDLPGYAEYRDRTRRLVPFVW